MPALLALLTAAAGHAETRQTVPPPAAVSHLQSLNFSVVGQQEYEAAGPLRHGMLTQQEVGAGSFFGVGLVKMRGRKKDGSDLRPGADRVVTDNPAVTFVIKF